MDEKSNHPKLTFRENLNRHSCQFEIISDYLSRPNPSNLHVVPRSKKRNIHFFWAEATISCFKSIFVRSVDFEKTKNVPFLSQLTLNETMLQDWGRNSCFLLMIVFQFISRVRNIRVNLVRWTMRILFDCLIKRPTNCCLVVVVVVVCSVIEQSKSHYWFGVTELDSVKPSWLDIAIECTKLTMSRTHTHTRTNWIVLCKNKYHHKRFTRAHAHTHSI